MKRKNLLHDLLSSQVLVEKIKSSTIPKKKRICRENNSGLYACKICFTWNSPKTVDIEKRHFSENEKESLRQIFQNSEPFQSDAFVGICTKCEQLLIEYRKLRQRMEEIAMCIKTVHKLQNSAVDIKEDTEPGPKVCTDPIETKYYEIFAPKSNTNSSAAEIALKEDEINCLESTSENSNETKYYEIFAPKEAQGFKVKEIQLKDDGHPLPGKIQCESNIKNEEEGTLTNQDLNLELNEEVESLETSDILLKSDFEICVEEDQPVSQLFSDNRANDSADQIDNSPNPDVSSERQILLKVSSPQNKIKPKEKITRNARPKNSSKYLSGKCGRRFRYQNGNFKIMIDFKPSHQLLKKHIGKSKTKSIISVQDKAEFVKIVEDGNKRPQRASKVIAEKRLSSLLKENSADDDAKETEINDWESESKESNDESENEDEETEDEEIEDEYPDQNKTSKILNWEENANIFSKDQETNKFRCHFSSCDRRFPTLETLRPHVKKHFQVLKKQRLFLRKLKEKEFGKRRTECEICQMKFSHRQAHASHKSTNLHYLGIKTRKVDTDGTVSYHCNKSGCLSSFPKLRQLSVHFRQHPSESRRNCEACGISFYRVVASNYTETMNTCRACLLKVGKGNLMRKCGECDREFTSRSTFLLHIASENHKLCLKSRKLDKNGEVSFPCERKDCHKIFNNWDALRNHYNKHWYYCKHCDEKLENAKSYAVHLWGVEHEEKIRGINDPNLGAERETYRVFACTLCCKTFGVYTQWRKHIESHDTEKVLICENCGLSYKSQKSFQNHLKTHEEGYQPKPYKKPDLFVPLSEKQFQCLDCKRRFTAKNRLNWHIKTYHAGIPHKCEICHKDYASKNGLAKHKNVVHEGKKVKKCKIPQEKCICCICERTFARSETYQRHLELVHLQQKKGHSCPYKCQDNQKFGSVSDWKSHLEICKSDKMDGKARCWFCSEIFPNQLLRMHHHIKSHETFPCKFCKKSFTRRHVLSYHLSTHKENKPWICEKCGKTFPKDWNLKIHMTTVCNDDEESKKALALKRKEQYKIFREKSKSHKCPSCPKRFVDEKRLNEHKTKEHDDNEEAIGSDTESR